MCLFRNWKEALINLLMKIAISCTKSRSLRYLENKYCLHDTVLVTSTKEVILSLCLFVCLLAGLSKTTQPISQNSGKVANGPQKNPLDFGGNSDPIMLG